VDPFVRKYADFASANSSCSLSPPATPSASGRRMNLGGLTGGGAGGAPLPNSPNLSLPGIPGRAGRNNGPAMAMSANASPRSIEEVQEHSISGPSRLVHLTDHFVVSVPYAASSQYSMTIAPRRHCAHFLDATPEELHDLSILLALLSQVLYHGLDDPSYNIFIRTAPCVDHIRLRGREVGADEIAACCHWMLELRPRFPADLGGFEIASGVRVVSGLPEDHAAELRGWVKERLEDDMRPVVPVPEHPAYSRAASKNSSKAVSPRLSQGGGSRIGSRQSTSRVPSKTAWAEAQDMPRKVSN